MGCSGCTPAGDEYEQAKRSARAVADGTNGRISYEDALAQELALLAPMTPQHVDGNAGGVRESAGPQLEGS